MKTYKSFEYTLYRDRHLSEEIDGLVNNAIFHKCSMLEDHYLRGFSMAGDKILKYLRFLRENVLKWKTEYPDWTEVWIREVKPYILENFGNETWVKSNIKGNGNLYDCLSAVAYYLDLHIN